MTTEVKVRNSSRVEAWVALGGPSGQDIRAEQIFSVLSEEAKAANLIARSRMSNIADIARAIAEATILSQVRDLQDPFYRAIALIFFEKRGVYFESAALRASHMQIGRHTMSETGWSGLSQFFEVPLEKAKGLSRIALSCGEVKNFLC